MSDEPKTISKTHARKEFSLTTEDLSFLTFERRGSTHLYDLDQVRLLAQAVHGRLDEFFQRKKIRSDFWVEWKVRRDALVRQFEEEEEYDSYSYDTDYYVIEE